jgi:lipoprotein-releasing system permease protein
MSDRTSLVNELWLEWRIATRFLVDNYLQTLLIAIGIAVGSAVIVFITALIDGLQANIIDRTLGTQAHIRLLPPDEFNHIAAPPSGTVQLVLESKRAQGLQSISNWQEILSVLSTQQDIDAVSPLISGPALARRGAARSSVALMGVDPVQYQRIIPIQKDMIAGKFIVGGGNAVIGKELAQDFGVQVGDKIRLDAGEGREAYTEYFWNFLTGGTRTGLALCLFGYQANSNPAGSSRWHHRD